MKEHDKRFKKRKAELIKNHPSMLLYYDKTRSVMTAYQLGGWSAVDKLLRAQDEEDLPWPPSS